MMLGREAAARRWLRVLWSMVLLLLATRLVTMAWIPLMDTTEGRYGEIGRKMATLDDWITPWHDHGVPFWGKPPLSFWLTAGSFKLLAFNEFTARLPHFLCGVLTAMCVWNAARVRASDEGAITVAILAGALLFHVSTGAVMTDPAMVLGTTMAQCSVWLALAGQTAAQRARHGWLAFIGGAIGVLAKGPLALILIGAPLFLWMLWCSRWRTVWQALPWVRGSLLMASLVLPWFVLAELKTPGFINYFIVGEHFHRFVTPGWGGDLYGNAHERPKGTIWLYAFGAMLPWTVLLPLLAVRRWMRKTQADHQSTFQALGPWRIEDRETERLVALQALAPLLFFTASSNIIWTYVLPAMPALAWWAARWLGRQSLQGLRWTALGTLATWVALTSGLLVAEKNERFERGSGRSMVALCEAERMQRVPQAERRDADPMLVVVGRRSLSADYYAAGRSPRVLDLAPMTERWPAAGQCVALFDNDRGKVEEAGLRVARELGRTHERRVLWVVRSHAAGTVPAEPAR